MHCTRYEKYYCKCINMNDFDISENNNNLLFLDINGVLVPFGQSELCHHKCQLLSEIINKHQLKICITSSWRMDDSKYSQLVNNPLFKNVIIGHLPITLPYYGPNIKTRSIAIKKWLRENKPIGKWICIDDFNLFDKYKHTKFMKGHFVWINPSNGLTKPDTIKMDELLSIQ